jgi:hypothetical protein
MMGLPIPPGQPMVRIRGRLRRNPAWSPGDFLDWAQALSYDFTVYRAATEFKEYRQQVLLRKSKDLGFLAAMLSLMESEG